jgi:predicted RNase H-like nuclease (RuvC/YqgF family)
MIDPNLVTLIIAILINAPTLYLLRSNKKKADAESRERDATGKKLEDEITERVLKRADSEIAAQAKKIDELQAALMVEQEARNADKAQHEAKHDALRMELQAEREARESDRVAHDKEIAEMRDELTDLRMGVGILTAQLIEVGRTPRWKPRNSGAAAATNAPNAFKR